MDARGKSEPISMIPGNFTETQLTPTAEREGFTASPLPFLGLGMGLRARHYQHILNEKPKIDWFEIISENFLYGSPRSKEVLEQILDTYPVVMHGVAMYPGNAQGLDFNYLHQLKLLIREANPPWISDHLCWGSVDGRFSHDLLPLPYTQKTLENTAENLRIAQDFLETPLIMENVSSYASFKDSHMEEWEFISEIAERSGTGLLLDVNNVYVSARNHGFDAREYLNHIDVGKVQQIHVAGHSDHGNYVLDTHNGPVIPEVWELYNHLIEKTGPRTTMIEWDADIPEFEVVWQEIQQARTYWEKKKPAETKLNQHDNAFASNHVETSSAVAEHKDVEQVVCHTPLPEEMNFQRLMLAGVLAPYALPGHSQEETLAIAAQQIDAATDLIQPHGKLSNTERLELYRKQIRIRFHESLQDDFTLLGNYLKQKTVPSLATEKGTPAINQTTASSSGDSVAFDLFEQILDEYLAEHPASSHSLWNLGKQMPEFLQKHYPKDQTAAELAKLDLAVLDLSLLVLPRQREPLVSSLPGADSPSSEFSFSGFTFGSGIAAIQLSCPSMTYASRFLPARDGLSGEKVASAIDSIALIAPALHDKNDPGIFLYPPAFAELLRSVGKGGTLGEILERCHDLPNDAELRQAFGVWQQNRWLVTVRQERENLKQIG
jgi:hypothetical protein